MLKELATAGYQSCEQHPWPGLTWERATLSRAIPPFKLVATRPGQPQPQRGTTDGQSPISALLSRHTRFWAYQSEHRLARRHENASLHLMFRMVSSTATPVATTVSERDHLFAEHEVLTWLQYGALQKSPYMRMSVKDAEAYDRRRLRLREVDERLAALET
jgi:hypothetical protein